MNKNEGTYDEALLLIMERNGYPEETYYTFSYSPIPGEDGNTAGIICANTDDTERIIGERQLRTLKDLGKAVIDCKTSFEVFEQSMEVLRQNPWDFPFAFIYQVSADGSRLNFINGTAGPVFTLHLPPFIHLPQDPDFPMTSWAAQAQKP